MQCSIYRCCPEQNIIINVNGLKYDIEVTVFKIWFGALTVTLALKVRLGISLHCFSSNRCGQINNVKTFFGKGKLEKQWT